MGDGQCKPIVSAVIDDYAAFIVQRLNEHLDADADFAPDAGLDIGDLLDVDAGVPGEHADDDGRFRHEARRGSSG